MKFIQTSLAGAYIIELDPIHDERGFFSRIFCVEEFLKAGLKSEFKQYSIAFNHWKGTLRGMHYQIPPDEEVKLVRCTMGALYDVIVDLRRDSPTFKKWFSVELSAKNRKILYIPEGVAHGYQTLEDNTEAFYQISEKYAPQNARGVRWNDPAFAIVWPQAVTVISQKDQNYPDFTL